MQQEMERRERKGERSALVFAFVSLLIIIAFAVLVIMR
jgi:hypothetical protein